MIISQALDLCFCKPSNVHCSKKTFENTAFALDCLASITLLAIGILFLTGVLSLSPAAGWAILGAGCVYSAAMLLYICNRTRISCST